MEYIDCITFERINEKNLITLVDCDNTYYFDAKTLYRYKLENGKFLNPFTKKELDNEIIEKTTNCIKQNCLMSFILIYGIDGPLDYQDLVDKDDDMVIKKYLVCQANKYDFLDLLLTSVIQVLYNDFSYNIEDCADKKINEYSNLTFVILPILDVSEVKSNIIIFKDIYEENYPDVYIEITNYLENIDLYKKKFVEKSSTDDVNQIMFIEDLPYYGLLIITDNNFEILYHTVKNYKRTITSFLLNLLFNINNLKKYIDELFVYILKNNNYFILDIFMPIIRSNSYDVCNIILNNLQNMNKTTLHMVISSLDNYTINILFDMENHKIIDFLVTNMETELLYMCSTYLSKNALEYCKELLKKALEKILLD